MTRPGAEPVFDPQAVPPAYEKARFAWPIDPQRFHLTEALIKLRPRDMATFGQLFLQAGQWNGRQVVPAAWVRQATTAQTGKVDFPDFGGSAPGSAFNPTDYGYFWWVEPTTGVPAYYAWGSGGQLVEVVPSLHLVIAVSSYVDETHPANQPSEATSYSTWSTRSCRSSRPIRLAESGEAACSGDGGPRIRGRGSRRSARPFERQPLVRGSDKCNSRT